MFVYTCIFYCYNEYPLSLDNTHVRSWSTLKSSVVSCCMFIPVVLQPNFIKTYILKYHPNVYDEILRYISGYYCPVQHGAFLWNVPNSRNIDIIILVGFKNNLVEEEKSQLDKDFTTEEGRLLRALFSSGQTQWEDCIQCHVGLPISSMVWQCSHVLNQGFALSGKQYQTCIFQAFFHLFNL